MSKNATETTTPFRIRSFDDYHEIVAKGLKAVELGCFPQKGYDYCRYFGLFYKGRRPSFAQVWPRLRRRIDFGPVLHGYTGDDISIDEKEVIREVKRTVR